MFAATGSSNRLESLINRLRLYKPPSVEEEEQEEEEEVGVAELTAPRPERFRPKRAAVLVCLFEGERGDLRVFLTLRSSKLSSHSGEVSLPGGKAEEGDADDAATATREAREEIGLDPSLVTVATSLEPFLSRYLLRVVPVIGILSDKDAFKPAANADEVEEIFDAPLGMFLKEENHRSEEREWMGAKFVLHYFDYETENKRYVIWGLTASILVRAASVVYQRPPPFPDQCPKFKLPKSCDMNILLP